MVARKKRGAQIIPGRPLADLIRNSYFPNPNRSLKDHAPIRVSLINGFVSAQASLVDLPFPSWSFQLFIGTFNKFVNRNVGAFRPRF
jgi:hypothetical protein